MTFEAAITYGMFAVLFVFVGYRMYLESMDENRNGEHVRCTYCHRWIHICDSTCEHCGGER